MEKNDFLHFVITEPIRDILVSGYVDLQNIPVFHPLYERIYLIFDQIKIEICVGDESKIIFTVIENIRQWIDVDEDDLFSVMSIYSLVFKTEQVIRIISAACGDSLLSGLKLKYIDGEAERCVTFDPKNFFGFSFE
ncbi:hypothetical protein [Chryseobacterium vrystaatense]|uniref:Uncharacterized protein n=1 Tax=Chryseobacterium vrystaatense TaxID=307480 RepID=A0ABR4ULY4_9FLAO|nr:hypothetical protein [Chryseobacterium vrystaatense]KFF25947.1 hypothetical protein IW16_13885 [Chryseobacterium vrystaatense]